MFGIHRSSKSKQLKRDKRKNRLKIDGINRQKKNEWYKALKTYISCSMITLIFLCVMPILVLIFTENEIQSIITVVYNENQTTLIILTDLISKCAYLFFEIFMKFNSLIIPIIVLDFSVYALDKNNDTYKFNKINPFLFKVSTIATVVTLYCFVIVAYMDEFIKMFDVKDTLKNTSINILLVFGFTSSVVKICCYFYMKKKLTNKRYN